MKTLLLIVTLLLSVTLHAQEFRRLHAERLLSGRRLSLEQFEQRGSELLLGEVTGAGRTLNIERVEVLFLADQAILKSEIESLPQTDLDSFRAHGIYYTVEDIRAVLLKKTNPHVLPVTE